jgi:hypothetical protein
MTLGWTVFFLIPYQLPAYATQFHFLAITFFVAHRYFTFPLVYMDRVEFGRHRIIYTLTPVLCILLVVLCYYFRVDEPEMFAIWYLFNFFHFVRQKYGILRIYSGKAQWGHKRLDEWAVYSWSLGGFFYLFSSQAELEGRIMHYLNQLGVEALYIATFFLTIGWMIYQAFSVEGKVKPALPFLAIVGLLIVLEPGAALVVQTAYAASVLLTVTWFIYEWRAPGGLNVPKILFFYLSHSCTAWRLCCPPVRWPTPRPSAAPPNTSPLSGLRSKIKDARMPWTLPGFPGQLVTSRLISSFSSSSSARFFTGSNSLRWLHSSFLPMARHLCTSSTTA